MNEPKLIHGAGGALGGGGNQRNQKAPRQPTLTQDNSALQTISFAQLQFLLCEGEIAGPVLGNTIDSLERSTYLDDTAIRTNKGISPQPEDLVLSFGRAAAFQSGVPGYEQVSNIIGVDKVVKNGLPVSQAIVGTDPAAAYSARVLLTFQGLYRQIVAGQTAGDVLNHSCDYGIFYTDGLGTVRGPGAIALTDKFSSAFQREHEFGLEGPGPWTVTVYRYQQDDSDREIAAGGSEKFSSQFSFSSIVFSTYQQLRYPHSSILTLGLRADQYNQIPAVAIELFGSIIEIPSNYNPVTATYSGVWGGTFVRAYSNNPAWIIRDLIINDRYGLGSYIDPVLANKWSLYEIAQYCDQLVPDGKGGTERRFTCNVILQTAEEAWIVLQQFASIFRGVLYYAGASIVAVQDRPKEAIYTFSESNTIEQFADDTKQVSEGNFIYAGSSKRARHTVVLVSWDDPADSYQPRVEYVPDAEGIAKYGYRPLDLRLVGVTSKGQALRSANWALLTENLLDDTITFEVNEIGSAIRPGDLVKIADPNKAAVRMGGRVVLVQEDGVVKIDELPSPPGGWTGASFSFMAADYTQTPAQPVLIKANILSVISENRLEVGWIDANRPSPGWPFLIEVPSRTAQLFRVLSVAEDSNTGHHSISALRYRDDLYDAVDFGSPLTDNGDYLWKPQDLAAPTITEAQVIWDSQAKIDVRWAPPVGAAVLGNFNLSVSGYRVQYQEGRWDGEGITWNGSWKEIPRQLDTFEFIPVPKYVSDTRYRVRVAAVSRLGPQSEWATSEVKTVEQWFPMPDLAIAGSLTHKNLSTGGHEIRLSVSLAAAGIPPYVTGRKVEFRPAGGDWGQALEGALATADQIILSAASTTAVRASFTTAIPGLQGSTYALDSIDRSEIIPPAPRNLRVVTEGGSQSRIGQRRYSWELGSTPFASNWLQGFASDVTAFEIRYRQGDVPDWDRSFPLFSDGIPGDQTWFATSLFDYGEWVVMIRTRDRSGWLSDGMAVATVGIGDPIPTNVVQRYDLQDGGYPGSLDNFTRLVLGDGVFYTDPLTDPIYFAPLDDQFYEGLFGTSLVQVDVSRESTYIFQFECANEAAQLVIFTQGSATYRWFVQPGGRDLDLAYPLPRTDTFYSGSTLMYPIPDSATSAGWHPYAINEEVPQGIHELKLVAISTDGTTPAVISDVDVVLDYPDVVYTANDIALPSAGDRINFPAGTFRVLKAVSLTMQDDGSLPGVASTATIRLKDRDFVDVRPLDSTGAPAAGIVDLIAVGY